MIYPQVSAFASLFYFGSLLLACGLEADVPTLASISLWE
jgi:hypothetical protein